MRGVGVRLSSSATLTDRKTTIGAPPRVNSYRVVRCLKIFISKKGLIAGSHNWPDYRLAKFFQTSEHISRVTIPSACESPQYFDAYLFLRPPLRNGLLNNFTPDSS